MRDASGDLPRWHPGALDARPVEPGFDRRLFDCVDEALGRSATALQLFGTQQHDRFSTSPLGNDDGSGPPDASRDRLGLVIAVVRREGHWQPFAACPPVGALGAVHG